MSKPKRPVIGDFVQHVVQGEEQFLSPAVVSGFSDDGDWAFFEGSEAGVVVSELVVVDPPERDTKPLVAPRNPGFKPTAPAPPSPPVHDGPFVSFPLANGNKLELRLLKPISKKDFERVKALIALSEESLVEPDPSDKV